MEGRPPSRRGDGSYFFIESDEYDSAYFEKFSKFRSYQLNDMILTSLEFDHADIFENVEQIKDEFRTALKKIEGRVYFDSSYKHATDLLKEFDLEKTPYGYKQTLEILSEGEEGTEFSFKRDGRPLFFKTNLVGRHNILNLIPCIHLALDDGFDLGQIKDALLDLKLVKRRQEYRGKYKGSIVIDDFAHHPRAVEYVIDTIKKAYPSREVTVIFEPNSATARSSIFQNEFTEAFMNADRLIFTLPARATSAMGAENIDGRKVCETLRNAGKAAVQVDSLEVLLSEMERYAVDDNVFLVLSNGTCLGLWESVFVSKLS